MRWLDAALNLPGLVAARGPAPTTDFLLVARSLLYPCIIERETKEGSESRGRDAKRAASQ
jgi:hypothetical protein